MTSATLDGEPAALSSVTMRRRAPDVRRPLWTTLAALARRPPSRPALAGPAQAGERTPRSAAKVVAAMQPGWNLGNTLDAIGADETAWGNPRVTQELLDDVRAQGSRASASP